MSKLVIVESPAKAKTIKKYLGRGYQIVASMGHLRDLPKSKIGVDIENDFQPKYINIKGKGPIIKELKKYASKSDMVYLAADPDREGEAISWHLSYILNLDLKQKNRITFNEITKTGVKQGIKNPRQIDINLVDAQQARRVLDRLVGYNLSPFLWKKVRPGLSAGRVQSVAVQLIVDRENEIKNFKQKEYWTIEANLKSKKNRKTFNATLDKKNGKKIEIENEKQADEILKDIENEKFIVGKIKKSVRKKSPSPPFSTSTLQQEASSKLNFTAAKTMQIAQQLYEGVNTKKHGMIGLITYMRTDSLRISNEALAAAKEYILKNFDEEYLPKSFRIYKGKSSAQDGHEAIRPTVIDLSPVEVKDCLNSDQFKLYKLIWSRFIASQMQDAKYNTASVEINCKEYLFKTSGSSLKFPGFLAVLDDKKDENQTLPELEEKEELEPKKIEKAQHFTQPPPRYTEASLTKTLEDLGIGRPSTYVPTITTIVARNYVEREKKALKPTELGETITTIMKENFSNVINVSFTAKIEEDFDRVADGKLKWKDSIREFYNDFYKTLKEAEKNTSSDDYRLKDEETDEICDVCGKPMVIKHGRFGKFLACSGYPECKNTKKILIYTEGICPNCNARIIEKKSTKGRIFYGCEKYPKCKFVSWDEPVSQICPKCKNTMFKKKGRTKKTYCIICDVKEDEKTKWKFSKTYFLNSFKSTKEGSAPLMLKKEMQLLNSLTLEVAEKKSWR